MKNIIIENANQVTRRWLSVKEAARYLGCSEALLNKDRMYFKRIPFARLGGKLVKYDRADLDAHLESTKATPGNYGSGSIHEVRF